MQPPPTFAQSLEDQSAHSAGDPILYAASGAKIKDSTKSDLGRDDDNSSGGGVTPHSPPIYMNYPGQNQSGGPGDNMEPTSVYMNYPGQGGDIGLPEAPIAHAQVCLPAAPGDAQPAPAISAASPDYDDLAARFAALSR